jgi:hypothetical protein
MTDCPTPSIDRAEFFRWCRQTLDEHAENPNAFAVNEPEKNFVIDNIIPPGIKEMLGTKTDSLILSRHTFIDHLKHGVTPENYISFINGIKACMDYHPTRDFHVGLIFEREQPWLMVLKTSKDYKEAYIVTLHRVHGRTTKQIRKAKPK